MLIKHNFFLHSKMIKVSSNQSYEFIKTTILPFFESLYESIDCINDKLPKYDIASSGSKHLKEITPLTLNYEDLIHSDFIQEFISAVNYIRESFDVVSSHLNQIDTRKWNRDEIIYDISEFNTVNGMTDKLSRLSPRSQHEHFHQRSQKEIVMNAFSKTNLRYMCIKSEIVIYVYYVMLSMSTSLSINESLSFKINDLESFLGGFNYVIHVIEGMNSDEIVNKRARYIWELTTLFNLFLTSRSSQTRYAYSRYVGQQRRQQQHQPYLPIHHLFEFERRLLHEDIFGQYSVIDDENESIITEYVDNYKNIIHTIHILLKQDEISITKLITTLFDIVKTESKYEITLGIVIN